MGDRIQPEPTAVGHIAGLAVLDEKGRVVHTTGIATSAAVKARIADTRWLAELRARRLWCVKLERESYIALLGRMEKGDVVILSRSEHDAVFDFLCSVDFVYDLLNHLITDRHESMMVVDRDAKVVYFSPVHEEFFGLDPGGATGRPVGEIIENSKLHEVIRTGKAEIGVLARVRGTERVISRMPIIRQGKVIGAIGRVMFKGRRQVEELSRRVNKLESEVEFYKREVAAAKGRTYVMSDLIGDSKAMKRLRSEIVKVAPLEMPVLITGESGTGKELIAHSLHTLSLRREGPLVLVNATALPATLVETELFGYEAGAFTGAARKGRKGKFEQAAEGTIFLDEIGDMPIEVQSKLLRVLQDRVVERVGGERGREIDFRLICATNCDLHRLVADSKFRLDLYYRIAPIVIGVPPLRDRLEDIPQLVEVFLREVAERHHRPIPEVTDDALNYLCDQRWPGNVRQLRHEMERAFVFTENGRITADDLAMEQGGPEGPSRAAPVRGSGTPRLKDLLTPIESDAIRLAMKRHRGNKKRVAEELGVSRSFLYQRLALVDDL